MKRSIVLHGQQVSYELTRKPVKYVNIRVRADGSVSVSAGEWVSEGQIEAILQARALFLLRALEKFSAQADRRPAPLSYRTGELLYLLGKRYGIHCPMDPADGDADPPRESPGQPKHSVHSFQPGLRGKAALAWGGRTRRRVDAGTGKAYAAD